MTKRNLKRISSLLTAFGVLVSGIGAKAVSGTEPLVYEAVVKQGTDVYGVPGSQERKFGHARLDFQNGSIGVSTLPSAESNGTTAYALVPNGKEFLFSYIVDPSTGKLSLAVNGEIEATGICTDLKGTTSINEKWYTGWKQEGPALQNAGVVKPAAQSAEIAECDTASVKIKLVRPIQYADIAKLGIYTSSGTKITVSDYTKDNNVITLKTAVLLSSGTQYTVKGTNIPDIYGGTSNISVTFTPQKSGVLTKGKDVTPSKNVARAWGFERRIDWHEESELTKNNGWRISQAVIGYDDDTDFYKRLYAMKLSKEYVKEGKYSLKWDNHPYYPTLATEIAEKDWTGANMFNMRIYSEKATNEVVTLLIYSDNPNTPWKDGYTYPIKIDWEGEKEISIPLNKFNKFENPAGFDNVSGIYFTTKIYNGSPSPDTVLYLDDINVTYSPDYPITPSPAARVVPENTHRGMPYDASRLNHGGDEVKKDAATPYEYVAYNKTERALYGYNPQYMPGVASFDKDGKIYIRADGTHIQYLDENNKWKVVELDSYVKKYLRVWDGGSPDEPVIRFDNDGWAYVLVTTDSGSILCWSSDGMKTWKTHQLPEAYTFARFEHIEGNNTDAMNRPPLIMNHSQSSSYGAAGILTIPTKTNNGNLSFKTVKYADVCMNTAVHTGDGNCIISSGDTAYVVYGIYNYSSLSNPVEKIPSNHPALSMQYDRSGTALYFKNGVPAFVRKINLTDGSVSDPVFVGFGGVANDDHNWPGISMDSEGYIHVIMNGHHDPACYTKSAKPNDISSWSDIEQIGTFNSYGSILIDKNDEIHIMTRDASRGYRFDISVTSKAKGGSWTKSYVIKRTAPYYEVARQRMSYNPLTNDIYIHYYSQSDYFEVFKDEYDGIVFTWPNEERTMLITPDTDGALGVLPRGTDRLDGSLKHKRFFELTDAGNGREGVLVKSTDRGKTFKMLKTSDCIK